jgi:hypothetical protein
MLAVRCARFFPPFIAARVLILMTLIFSHCLHFALFLFGLNFLPEENETKREKKKRLKAKVWPKRQTWLGHLAESLMIKRQKKQNFLFTFTDNRKCAAAAASLSLAPHSHLVSPFYDSTKYFNNFLPI